MQTGRPDQPSRRQGRRGIPRHRSDAPSSNSLRRASDRRRHPTPIERALAGILSELHLAFLREYWIEHFWVDFALRDYFVVIEADGRLFHNDPAREDNRDRILLQSGWRSVHLYGPNIMNERHHVIEQIKAEVRQARVRPRPAGSPAFRDVRLDWDRPRPAKKLKKRKFRHRGEELPP